MTRLLFLLFVALCGISAAKAQSFSPEELHSRAIHRRAVEAVIWGMPAVNYDLMRQEMLDVTDAEVGQVIY